MSSPAVDGKIAAYEARIEEHRAEIKEIKAQPGYNMLAEPYMGMIKSKEDGILACETAIHDLRQGQLGEFFSDTSTLLSSSFETCFWLSVK